MRDRYLSKGKRVDDGEWVRGNYREIPPPLQCIGKPEAAKSYIFIENPYVLSDWGMPRQMCLMEVDPTSVGQCAGLHAAKSYRGKSEADRLVFEGDILNESGYTFVVVYDTVWAKFKLQHDNKTIQYPEWNRGIKMEIIGNIHDRREG